MRKMIVGAVVLSAVLVSMASADQVKSKNAVGFVRVDVPSNALTIVAVPFNTMNDSGVYTLDDLIGTNLFASWSSTEADEVLLWNLSETNYSSAFLNDDGWDDPNINWKWCYMEGGTPKPCAGNEEYDLLTGDAFWIRNRHESRTLYFMGEVPDAPTTTVSFVEGLKMFANPYPVTKTLDDLISTTNSGAKASWNSAQADEIMLWDGREYRTAFLNDNGWADPDVDWKWCYMEGGKPKPCAANEDYNLSPGQGLWYRSRGGTFDWSAVKPYDWP